MLSNRTRVLLILPQDVLDRARVLAGKATTTFKRPVSLQIVLRALIEVLSKKGFFSREEFESALRKVKAE